MLNLYYEVTLYYYKNNYYPFNGKIYSERHRFILCFTFIMESAVLKNSK